MRRRLVEGLNTYGQHRPFCSAIHPREPGPCGCGFDELRDLPARREP